MRAPRRCELLRVAAPLDQLTGRCSGCNLLGGYLGARVAVAKGTRFVRSFFIVVVGGFIVRIGGSVLGIW